MAWIAVLGDSPVFVLDRAGCLCVGPNHNIRSNEAEREAAVARGGVVCGGYLCPPRSDFGLQMSRALGDSWLDGILSREPEVITVPHPAWVLVASDGVFDETYGNSFSLEAVQKLAERNATAEDVLSWAKGYLFRDNATAVVWVSGSRHEHG
jgi:serine/threonine protein phosphatase PrpC